MISVYDYILKALQINEGYMTGNSHNWKHRDDYKYIIAVLNNLLIEDIQINTEFGELSLDDPDKKDKIAFIKSFFGENVELNQIKNYINSDFLSSNNKQISDFNKAIASTNKYKDIKKCWQKIEKTQFSGVTVKTRDQEIATCILFNILSGHKENGENIDKKNANEKMLYDKYSKITLDNLKHDIKNGEDNDIKKILKEFLPNVKFDKTWMNSFFNQLKAIKTLLTSNNTNFVMERYNGDKNYNNWEISKAYGDSIKKYIELIEKDTNKDISWGKQKDNYDPTDVILYDINEKENIKKILNECIQSKNIQEFKQHFYTLYFNERKQKNMFYGISLKQLNHPGKCVFYNISNNIHKNVKVNSISKVDITARKKINYDELIDTLNLDFIDKTNENELENIKNILTNHIHITDSGISLFCKAQIPKTVSQNNIEDVKKIVDNETHENINFLPIKIIIRTNGNAVACDVTICGKKNPSLGKCSVDVWKPVCNINDDVTINANNFKNIKPYIITAFLKIYKNMDLDKLTKILQSAIKCGPNCLPFVLIH